MINAIALLESGAPSYAALRLNGIAPVIGIYFLGFCSQMKTQMPSTSCRHNTYQTTTHIFSFMFSI
jgi:hypothetical protein